MAEKHKSKYKAPKDLEKSQKPKARKDLKDYTEDDKKGSLNPKSTGDKQLNVLRKTDKEVIDTGDMYVKYNADDRLYKDLEDGEWEPKHAAKVLKKRQDKDEKDNAKNIKDKIENLTREQREIFKDRLVREFVRRKIAKLISEQPAPTPTEEEPTEPVDTEAPAPDAAAPAPEAPAPDAAAPAPAPAAEPTPAPAAEPQSDASKEVVVVQNFIDHLQNKGGDLSKIDVLSNVFHKLTEKSVPEDKYNFYLLLKKIAIKNLSSIDLTAKQETPDK